MSCSLLSGIGNSLVDLLSPARLQGIINLTEGRKTVPVLTHIAPCHYLYSSLGLIPAITLSYFLPGFDFHRQNAVVNEPVDRSSHSVFLAESYNSPVLIFNL